MRDYVSYALRGRCAESHSTTTISDTAAVQQDRCRCTCSASCSRAPEAQSPICGAASPRDGRVEGWEGRRQEWSG